MRPQGVLIGRASGLIPLPITLNEENRSTHTLVLGMTGSGKTTTLRTIIRQDMASKSVIIIDGKGDLSILGRSCSDFHYILFGDGVSGDLSFNPLRGPVDQVVSSFIDACGFENEFYRGCASRILYCYLRLCEILKKAPTIRELARLSMNISGFEAEIRTLPSQYEDLSYTLRTLLELSTSAYMSQHAGLVNRLDQLIQSSWCKALCGEENKSELSFDEAFENRVFIYVGLQKLANREGSQLLGRILLSRIGQLSSKRARMSQDELTTKPMVSVVVDELAGIAYRGFETLPQLVRSSRIQLTLSTQTLSDLKVISEDFAHQIQTNTGIKILHQQNNEVDADTWSKHFGTKVFANNPVDFVVDALDRKPAGNTPKSQVFKVSPNLLKNLPRGKAVIEQWGKRNKKISTVNVYDIEKLERKMK
jgi:type IV secretory pathway TraG/TraD family ATPase VirD4